VGHLVQVNLQSVVVGHQYCSSCSLQERVGRDLKRTRRPALVEEVLPELMAFVASVGRCVAHIEGLAMLCIHSVEEPLDDDADEGYLAYAVVDL